MFPNILRGEENKNPDAVGSKDSATEGMAVTRRGLMRDAGIAFAGVTSAFVSSNETKHRARHAAADIGEEVLPDNMYAEYPLKEKEYLGTVDADKSYVIEYLQQHGYEYQSLSAKKLHPDDGRPDDGSYRKLDDVDPLKQWHVHFWETDAGVELFSHYEYRPEPVNLGDQSHIAEHYEPTYGDSAEDGATYIQGRHTEDVKTLLTEDGSYEGDDGKVGSTELAPPTGELEDIFS